MFHAQFLSLILVATLWITPTFTVYADIITLKNGDQLHGFITSKNTQNLMLKHPSLGTLTIPRTQISLIQIKQQTSLTTPKNTATTNSRTPHPITHTPPTPASTKPTTLPTAIPLPATTTELSWFKKWTKTWKSHVEFGASIVDGNSENTSLRFAYATSKKTHTYKINADMSHNFIESNGRSTRNDFTAGLKYQWFFHGSPWSTFTQGRYDADNFQSWNYRVSGNGGVAYQLIHKPNFQLSLSGGLGLVKEFGSTQNQIRLEALFGQHLNWKITKKQKINFTNTFFPDPVKLSEFRLVTQAAWSLKIDQADGLSLKIGIQNEHQSQVDSGKKRNDVRIFSTMTFDF